MDKKNLLCTCRSTIFIALLSCVGLANCVEKPIVVVIPSYNNERWVENNLTSVFKQNYQNYRVIYVDDCSTDNTYKHVMELIEQVSSAGSSYCHP